MISFDKKPLKLGSGSKGPKSAVLRVQKVPRGLLELFNAHIRWVLHLIHIQET